MPAPHPGGLCLLFDLCRQSGDLLKPLGLIYPQYLAMVALSQRDGQKVSELGAIKASLDQPTGQLIHATKPPAGFPAEGPIVAGSSLGRG